MEQIAINSSIWDLHIHSCKSPKSSGEFQKLSTKDYIDKLLDIFKDYPDLSLISFTDHNRISYEVYNEFNSRGSNVNFIPGIEIDVTLKENSAPKHLIFYFNICIDKLLPFSEQINDFLKDKKSVSIHSILEFLIQQKIEFLISPHAFKQEKRAINHDWNDEDSVNKNAHKFMDQFFCFWEASGYSDIAKAIEFLESFDLEDKISVISFSDSSDENKLRNYLSNPPQYFKSLPNFKGIQLAGTDSNRILPSAKKINYDNSGNIIGFIEIDNQKIQLSDELNVIVGGRGSGKSVLLDNVALNLDGSIRDKNKLKKDRIEFLDSLNVNVFNIDQSKLKIDSKKIDYFDQSYVSKIFNSNNINKEIESYFTDEFSSLEDLNSSIKKDEIKTIFNSFLSYNKKAKPNDNISNFVENYRIIDEDFSWLKFLKSSTKDNKIITYDLNEAIEKINRDSKIIPKELKENTNIKKALVKLFTVINEEIKNYNKIVEIHNFEANIKKRCVTYSENRNQSIKNKRKNGELFISHFEYECDKYKERANIINAIIEIQNQYKPEDVSFCIKNGVDGNVFKFEKKLVYEEPIEYFKKMCVKYFGARINSYTIEELFDVFIYHLEEKLKNSKEIDDFINDLKGLDDYKIDEQCNILYGDSEDNLQAINTLSPGTQTNILMEYIVSKDTKIPLLIDQPEDNIDNETIYTKLTSWFRELKHKRQVIVVTHDANIVVNADAENVIIASKEPDGKFKYDYGALEYDNILNRISIILDGGFEAVERRLKKYGRESN